MERDEGMNQAIAYALAGMLPIAISAALVGVRDEIVNANAALALVVAVVVCSLLGGWRAGSVAAVVSTLCYDFFFTRPYRSLNMTSQDDIETTVLLLIVGLIVGVSAARARRTKTSAAAGRSEILRIHRLGELAVSGADVAVSGVHERRMSGGNFELPRDGVELGVVAHGETVGRFVLEPSPGVGVSLEQRVVAIALADQVGQAIGAAPRSPFTK
jgi:hypothetical protein